jgi:predicted aspartyl protease
MNSAAGAYSKDPALGVAILVAMMPWHRCYVPLRKVNGELSYVVPVIINRDYGPVVIVDTGFTGSLAIPRSIVDDLRAKGVLTNGDNSGPPVTSTLADGSKIIQETIIVREVILPGCHAFRNVPVIISPTGSVPLLGQGILSRFGSAAIDHKENSLVLVPQGLSH